MNAIPWSEQASLPLLLLLQIVPAIGALLVYLLRDARATALIGRSVSLAELLLAIELYRRYDEAHGVSLQFAERFAPLGYSAAADGITILFILLAALVVVVMTLYGIVMCFGKPRRLMTSVLLCEAAIMVALTTTHLLWFAAASLVELIVIGYLLSGWATSTEENRQLALARYVQFQSVGWLLFVAGIVVVAWNHADLHGGRWSFDLLDLAAAPPPGHFEVVAFFLIFYGLAVRTPLFPLHGWLPPVIQRGMVAVAPSLLLGIKLGIYGMVRFLLPLTPNAALAWQEWIVAFAMTGVFFAAALALLQTNLRRLMSFAVVSHTSLIVIGLFTLHPLGVQGAVLLSVTFGLAVTLMLCMVGFIYRRTGTTELPRLGGLFDRMPAIAIAFLIGGFAIIGMPGTPGFDAAHLVLEASIDRFGALPTIATALGNVAAAGFLLWGFQRAFLAPASEPRATIERTRTMERVVAASAVLLLLLTGFHMQPLLELTDTAVAVAAAPFGAKP